MSEVQIAKIVVGGASLFFVSVFGLGYLDEQRTRIRQLERERTNLLVERAELRQELRSRGVKLPSNRYT